mmetsp:Transcript_45327/g.114791  ORF Transcript_45327/g.114791 Transcript_45327/m.114791 type:complete len:236 (+) Transcript_45327:384-1091(+)
MSGGQRAPLPVSPRSRSRARDRPCSWPTSRTTSTAKSSRSRSNWTCGRCRTASTKLGTISRVWHRAGSAWRYSASRTGRRRGSFRRRPPGSTTPSSTRCAGPATGRTSWASPTVPACRQWRRSVWQRAVYTASPPKSPCKRLPWRRGPKWSPRERAAGCAGGSASPPTRGTRGTYLSSRDLRTARGRCTSRGRKRSRSCSRTKTPTSATGCLRRMISSTASRSSACTGPVPGQPC